MNRSGDTSADRVLRLLLVEDDAAIRSGLASTLGGAGYEIAEAADGLSALQHAERFRPDLAVIDIGLPPGPDGLAVTRRLRRERDVGILLLTAADETAQRVAGLDAGADDYVTKPFEMAEVLARLRAILRRLGADIGPLVHGRLEVDEGTSEVRLSDTVVETTATERQLLAELVRARGRTLTKAQLITLLWGHGQAAPNALEAHVARVRRKLRAAGADPISTVHGVGYRLEA